MPDFIPDQLVRSLPASVTILTAMITPALLISASGTFILSTSQRLGRVVDRVRALSEQMEQMASNSAPGDLREERRTLFFEMIERQSIRAKLLARALSIFYMASAVFVATSVAIGLISVFNPKYAWFPVVLGIAGASFLFYGSVILIFEARLAYRSMRIETHFLSRLVEHHTAQRVREVAGSG